MRVVFLFLFASIFSILAISSTKVTKISSNLGVVWGMTFLDENNMLISQKKGKISLLDLKSKTITNIKNVPKVFNKGQAGLFDIQNKNGWIYLTYAKNINGKGATTIARAKLDKDSLVNFQELLVSKSLSNTTAHFGSRITFDESGHLFFSIGDRGIRENGQDLKTHAGSILRLNLDGTVPKDNPFVNNFKALNEIYSYGHRNPQGLFYDKQSKKLYAIEHGPRGGDEINLIKKGSNYGWAIVSKGKEYWNTDYVGKYRSNKKYTDAIKVYTPSIAPSSLIVYSGKKYKSLKRNLLSGALKLRHLNRIVLNTKGEVIKEDRLLENLNERIRNVSESPNGEIYISTDSGNIYLLNR
ncbi:PQQ-dependent sugar dehydrogenase [Poseidonibacter ostreae]|jgi:aldose sugar dehydrogenase|uniref:PQQ-dependent sugar dehydrogenase n=1 Tax=Poseidonibacter ostreae TaxID=2654171 RepID=A0ABQ6VQ88_9BACT|nr:PQQ-dependent sugar dehydrogenase [Poseidonibacter ostreae]KAB7882013.1 PQQ-dependent sugar dehydrogenase [Poseidonibacter ostreae]KAB7892927.1 PQQ-dependent sugar dehydrogenase [Poseidonibacter ostreae]